MAEGLLVFEDFKDHLGTIFTPCDPGMPSLALTLEEAALFPSRASPDGMRPPFSLLFIGAGDMVLPQATYRLRHDNMGEVAIFLVPIGKDQRGVSYQAVFN